MALKEQGWDEDIQRRTVSVRETDSLSGGGRGTEKRREKGKEIGTPLTKEGGSHTSLARAQDALKGEGTRSIGRGTSKRNRRPRGLSIKVSGGNVKSALSKKGRRGGETLPRERRDRNE